MLNSPQDVIRCLLTYTDWYQPTSTSVLAVSGRRHALGSSDGFREGLLDTLDERQELRRRTSRLGERLREVLVLWYVRQLPVEDIARVIGRSRRQCFRLRARAVREIVDLGAADAPAPAA